MSSFPRGTHPTKKNRRNMRNYKCEKCDHTFQATTKVSCPKCRSKEKVILIKEKGLVQRTGCGTPSSLI